MPNVITDEASVARVRSDNKTLGAVADALNMLRAVVGESDFGRQVFVTEAEGYFMFKVAK